MKRITAILLVIVLMFGLSAYAEDTEITFYRNCGSGLGADGYYIGVPAATSTSELLEYVSSVGTYRFVSNGGGVLSGSDFVGSGTKLYLNPSQQNSDAIEFMVLGDVNGDGRITSLDYICVKRFFAGTAFLTGVFFDAGDITGDGEIRSTDYARLKKYFNATNNITTPLTPMPTGSTIIPVSPMGTTKASIANEAVKAAAKFTSFASSRYAELNPNRTEVYKSQGTKISWLSRVEGAKLIYGSSPDLSDGKVIVCSENDGYIKDLYAGKTYYYRIESTDGTYSTEILSFTTANEPRTVDIDGLRNTRDIGGRKTSNGKYIKQGILYRGERTTNITSKGIKDFTEKYGIKTELTLSGTDVSSALASKINVYRYEITSYSFIFESDQTLKNNLRDALLLLTDETNFPIYFHCYIGRDRTGTFAALIYALCGVNKTNISNEFCLSFLSSLGYYNDVSPDDAMASLNPFLSNLGSNPQIGARNFMKNTLGMTDAQLDAIVANCTETL